MKTALSVFLQAIGWALIIATAFVAPLKLQKKFKWYINYTGATVAIWFAYSILMTVIDAVNGNDVPGIGYLIVGFITWFIGSVIYLDRIFNRDKLR